jgi:hypothetical protein
MGHIAKFCPARREEYKRKHKRHHAHVVKDEEPPAKMIREQIKDHVLIWTLSGSVTPREDTWLIDSGASKHIMGQRNILSCISAKKFSQKVTLGDDYQYAIKGVGESNHKLNSGNSLKMKDILYVPGLTKNLLSISALEKKGFEVAFIDGEVLMWAKGETLNEAIIIGSEENGLYKLKGHSEAAMTHAIENSCELWHRRLAHINYKVLPYICKAVTSLPELKGDHEGVCNGCAQGKNIKNPFPKRDNKAERVLELIHSDVCGPMPLSSISGYVYYVSFIDDYSRKTWIYFLKSKDEVFSKFKEFKALILAHLGLPLSKRAPKTLDEAYGMAKGIERNISLSGIKDLFTSGTLSMKSLFSHENLVDDFQEEGEQTIIQHRMDEDMAEEMEPKQNDEVSSFNMCPSL